MGFFLQLNKYWDFWTQAGLIQLESFFIKDLLAKNI
jgi:hypothetical protein